MVCQKLDSVQIFLLSEALSQAYFSLVWNVKTFARVRNSKEIRNYLKESKKAAIKDKSSFQAQFGFIAPKNYKKVQAIRQKINRWMELNTIRYRIEANQEVYLISAAKQDFLLDKLTQLKEEFLQVAEEIKNSIGDDFEYIRNNTQDEKIRQEMQAQREYLNRKLDEIMQFTFSVHNAPIGYVSQQYLENLQSESKIIREYEKLETMIIAPLIQFILDTSQFIAGKRHSKSTINRIKVQTQSRTEAMKYFAATLQNLIAGEDQNEAVEKNYERLTFFTQELPGILDDINDMLTNMLTLFGESIDSNISSDDTPLDNLSQMKADEQLESKNKKQERIKCLIRLANHIDIIFQKKSYAVGENEQAQTILKSYLNSALKEMADELWKKIEDIQNVIGLLQLTQQPNPENIVEALKQINKQVKERKISLSGLSQTIEDQKSRLQEVILFSGIIVQYQNKNLEEGWKKLFDFIKESAYVMLNNLENNTQFCVDELEFKRLYNNIEGKEIIDADTAEIGLLSDF